jgi:hypothetical protein
MGVLNMSYNSNDTIVPEQGAKVLQELISEEFRGLSATSEDIVDNIVVLGRWAFQRTLDELGCVFDGSDVV